MSTIEVTIQLAPEEAEILLKLVSTSDKSDKVALKGKLNVDGSITIVWPEDDEVNDEVNDEVQ